MQSYQPSGVFFRSNKMYLFEFREENQPMGGLAEVMDVVMYI